MQSPHNHSSPQKLQPQSFHLLECQRFVLKSINERYKRIQYKLSQARIKRFEELKQDLDISDPKLEVHSLYAKIKNELDPNNKTSILSIDEKKQISKILYDYFRDLKDLEPQNEKNLIMKMNSFLNKLALLTVDQSTANSQILNRITISVKTISKEYQQNLLNQSQNKPKSGFYWYGQSIQENELKEQEDQSPNNSSIDDIDYYQLQIDQFRERVEEIRERRRKKINPEHLFDISDAIDKQSDISLDLLQIDQLREREEEIKERREEKINPEHLFDISDAIDKQSDISLDLGIQKDLVWDQDYFT